jgi:hypothetical protein
MAFTVRVVGDDGRGVSGRRIVLGFVDVARGQTAPQYTNADGRAQFMGYQPGDVKVFVDGNERGTHAYREGSTVIVTP